MLKNIFSRVRFWGGLISEKLFLMRVKPDAKEEFVLLVEKARKEWHWSENHLQEFTDKDLIDQAIFWRSAAERRYVHLLKQASWLGIKADLELVVFLALADRNNLNKGVGACHQRPGRLF